jgi:hypothetical protein
VSNKAELSAYRDMLFAIHENVSKLKQQGRSLDETLAAKGCKKASPNMVWLLTSQQ